MAFAVASKTWLDRLEGNRFELRLLLSSWRFKNRGTKMSDELIENVSRLESLEPEFIGGQEGLGANLLITAFKEALRPFPVERAYFCRVAYPSGEFGAAVCLAGLPFQDTAIVNALAAVVRQLVGEESHIDVIFVNFTQEEKIKQVCVPFLFRWQQQSFDISF